MTRDELLDRIETYRTRWHGYSNELQRKEAFKDLLRDLYAGDAEATRVLDAMTAGSETVVRNIPLADRTKTGASDTQYGAVIIEFEGRKGGCMNCTSAGYQIDFQRGLMHQNATPPHLLL